MKQIITALTILLSVTILSAFSNNDNDCYEHLRIGKFYFVKDNGDTLFIERTKRKHIETYNNKKSKLVCAIKWTSYNKYTLILKRMTDPHCLKARDKMYIEILECKADSYLARIRTENCGAAEFTIMKF
jgi:hypothetical protein